MTKPAILILHGWGLTGKSYNDIATLLEKEGFKVFSPDLPGFGAEPLTSESFKLKDYLNFVRGFINKNILGEYILIGHSFGGRIAILLAAAGDKNLKGVVLTGAAGIKHPLAIRSKIAFFLAKYPAVIFAYPPFSKISGLLRKFLYRFAREFDYYKSGRLRGTFRNIIGQDLTSYLSKIKIPTLIVWGENDFIVPLVDGELMNDKIKNSRLIVIEKASHKLPYEKPVEFFKAIKPFLI